MFPTRSCRRWKGEFGASATEGVAGCCMVLLLHDAGMARERTWEPCKRRVCVVLAFLG